MYSSSYLGVVHQGKQTTSLNVVLWGRSKKKHLVFKLTKIIGMISMTTLHLVLLQPSHSMLSSQCNSRNRSLRLFINFQPLTWNWTFYVCTVERLDSQKPMQNVVIKNNSPVKGLCGRCLSVWGPGPYPPLQTVYVKTVYLFTMYLSNLYFQKSSGVT